MACDAQLCIHTGPLTHNLNNSHPSLVGATPYLATLGLCVAVQV